jgi:hypothetical protein
MMSLSICQKLLNHWKASKSIRLVEKFQPTFHWSFEGYEGMTTISSRLAA